MSRSTTNDEELLAVKGEEKTELEKSDATFDAQIKDSDKYFDEQIDATKEWADKQQDLQQEQTDFIIDTIEQQKDQAKKDFTKEQSGAYADWQKQSNQYGVNAEKMAMSGMTDSGYSESSQVSMYNTYQSRVAAARDSYNRAVLNYDNAIKEAQLQNSSILAEIAYEALQKQLELSLQGFQYKNTLILEKAKAQREIQSLYQSKYLGVLDQINTENAMEQDKIQFEAQMALEREKFDWQKEQAEKAEIEKNNVVYIPTQTSVGIQNANSYINKTGKKSDTAKASMASELGRKISTYESAVKFMEKHGLSDGGQRLLTSQEWNKAKKQGQLGSELEYNTYTQYLRGYLEWRIQES